MISLKDLSLCAIAENFERFHSAFTAFNYEYSKGIVLLRKYYAELASKLIERKEMKNKYLEFLLHEHVKFFDEIWIMPTRYRNFMEDILCRLPNLTKIFCIEANDETLKNIAEFCPKIIEIEAAFSDVTDEGIRYLCEDENGSVPCPEIKKLSIDLYQLTVVGVTYIVQNLKFIEKLQHRYLPRVLYSLHRDDLPKLENVPRYNFYKLNMLGQPTFEPRHTYLLKIILTVCPKLKSLACPISDEKQLILFNNTGICLKRLSMFFNELPQKIIVDDFLRNCGRNLATLFIQWCSMSISKLAVSCPKLQKFLVDRVSFTEDHGNSKIIFRNLRSCFFCCIENSRLNDKAISLLLLSSPNLKYVRLISCYLSSETRINILKCCENCPLKLISFVNTMIEFSFVRDVLLNCSSLKTLCLDKDYYSFQEKEELLALAVTLSNKPSIFYD